MTSEFLKKFLGSVQIANALTEISQLKNAKDVDIAMAGGIAMQVYGSDRLTTDIDFLADRTFGGIKVIKKLSFGGVSGITVESKVPVDIIVRDDDAQGLYEEALAKARPSKHLLGAKVVGPEYMAAIKLYAGRVKDDEDLNFLIRSKAIDVGKTEKIIRRLMGAFAVKEFRSHVDEMTWRMEQERRK